MKYRGRVRFSMSLRSSWLAWPDLLQPYVKNDQVFVCPGSVRRSKVPTDQVKTYGGRLVSYVINNYYYNDAIGMENNLWGEIIFTSGLGIPTYAMSTVNLEADARSI